MDSLLALLRPRFGARVESLRNAIVYAAVRDALAKRERDTSIYDLLDNIERRDGALWPALARTVQAWNPDPKVVRARRKSKLRTHAGVALVFCVDAVETRAGVVATLARERCREFLDQATEDAASQLAWVVSVAQLALEQALRPSDVAARRLALDVGPDPREFVAALRSGWEQHPGTFDTLPGEISGTRQVEDGLGDSAIWLTSHEFRSTATLARRAGLRGRSRPLDVALLSIGTESFPVLDPDEARRRSRDRTMMLPEGVGRVLDRHVAGLQDGEARRYPFKDPPLKFMELVGASFKVRVDWRVFVERLSANAFAISFVNGQDVVAADFMVVRLLVDEETHWHVQRYRLADRQRIDVAKTKTSDTGDNVLVSWDAARAKKVNGWLRRLAPLLESLLDRSTVRVPREIVRKVDNVKVADSATRMAGFSPTGWGALKAGRQVSMILRTPERRQPRWDRGGKAGG